MSPRKHDTHVVVGVRDDAKAITITVDADEEWIEFVTKYDDIFTRTGGCGYWMRGMEYDDKLGWLCYEHGGERNAPDEAPDHVLTKWRKGEKLPRYYYRLDRAAALRAQAYGVRLRGEDWYEDGDGPFYDEVVQLALLGEERYG